jgi:O-methyltransferase
METNSQTSSEESKIILRELTRVLDGNIDGDVVEFGCYSGLTSIQLLKLLSGQNKKRLYVYDSFEGLPEKTAPDHSPLGVQFKAGELSVSKKQFIKNIQKANVPMPIIKKSWFSDLVSSDVPEVICFAYLDGDYYQSIKDSLKIIESKLAKTATIVVDDYYNESLPGVRKAVDEWLQAKNVKLKIENSLAIMRL